MTKFFIYVWKKRLAKTISLYCFSYLRKCDMFL